MNTLYDTPAGALLQEGKMVRIRVLSPAPSRGAGKKAAKLRSASASRQPALLTYKGPARDGTGAGPAGRRYKIREEQELRVENPAGLARVFEAMGLRPCFRYEKYRSTYRLPGLSGLAVELDETPIGDFLELEGAVAEIDRGAALLGFSPGDYIIRSYGALFAEYRPRAGDSDMLFG
jgi:adenylate cyclase class 2